MAQGSLIEWTDATWTVTAGCSMKSPGCHHCYAETMSKRLKGMARADLKRKKNPGGKAHYLPVIGDDGRWNHVVNPIPENLAIPLSWKQPRRVFVNSMSDLFWGDDEDLRRARAAGVEDPQPVPFDFIDKVFAVMALCPQHTFQVLTKRPERMAEYLTENRCGAVWKGMAPPNYHVHGSAQHLCNQLLDGTVPGKLGPRIPDAQWRVPRKLWAKFFAFPEGMPWPLPNVWLGTSVENQKAADERIPHLLRCPAAIRFLSCEPLLSEVNLTELRRPSGAGTHVYSALESDIDPADDDWGGATIHWVITGNESTGGRCGRFADGFEAAAYSILRQCGAAGVAYFGKQMPVKGKVSGNPAEWPSDLRVREFPEAAHA